MMYNRRGQAMLSVWLAIIFFLFGALFINFIKPDVLSARVGLDCSNVSGISDGTKLTCLIVDAVVPYFILLFVSIAGGIILDKVLK